VNSCRYNFISLFEILDYLVAQVAEALPVVALDEHVAGVIDEPSPFPLHPLGDTLKVLHLHLGLEWLMLLDLKHLLVLLDMYKSLDPANRSTTLELSPDSASLPRNFQPLGFTRQVDNQLRLQVLDQQVAILPAGEPPADYPLD
jgi:hypothetical protein